MTNPLEDESRWTLMGSRFETPDFIREAMNRMMAEFIESLPVDDPARQLWNVLPKAPGWGGDQDCAYTLDAAPTRYCTRCHRYHGTGGCR
jgi:hypothetical protein